MGRLIRGALAVLVTAGTLLLVPLSASVGGTGDEAGLVVSHDQLFIDEGSSKSFTVKLASEPVADDPGTDVIVSDDVNVQLWSNDESLATIDGADSDGDLFLTFTSDNWSTAQTVTVTTISDDDRTDEWTDIEFSTGSADADYYDLTHKVTVVALETERDEGTPTSVSAQRHWLSSASSFIVFLRWSGQDPEVNYVHRRNISLGETGFTIIEDSAERGYDPFRRTEYDSTVQTGINLYRVGSEDGDELSRTVAVFFYPAGGA